MDKITEIKSKLGHTEFENGGSSQSFRNGFEAAMDLQLPVLEWCKKANELLDDIDAALPHDDDWVKSIRELTEQFKTFSTLK